MPEMDSNDLVKRLNASDHEAFKAVFVTWQQAIFNFLVFKTRDTERAEDLLQEVFLKLWNARTRLNENQSLRNYLYTIADNLVLNEARHDKVVAKHRERTDAILFTNTQSPEFILEEKEWNNKLDRAIQALPIRKSRIYFQSVLKPLKRTW
jgi:RNA polymerase sigma-70 factor (ECF subfamily)